MVQGRIRCPGPSRVWTAIRSLCIYALIRLVYQEQLQLTFMEAITLSNARMILGSYDLILDCTSNALARYLINDTAGGTWKAPH